MSEQEQKPTYDALWSKVFTQAETIDTLEARLQNAEEDERAALHDYQRERARREQLEQELAQAQDNVAYWKRAYEERLDGLIQANTNIKRAFEAGQQQLAQAQEDYTRHEQTIDLLHEENTKQDETIEFLHIVIDDLKAWRTQAQALLEEINAAMNPFQTSEPLFQKLRAFLAKKEQQP